MRQRAVDELLEVLDRRLASKNRITHTHSLASTTTCPAARRVPMSLADFGADYTIMPAVVCPLCGTRRARRGCPALGQADLRGLLRHEAAGEIQCPADCA